MAGPVRHLAPRRGDQGRRGRRPGAGAGGGRPHPRVAGSRGASRDRKRVLDAVAGLRRTACSLQVRLNAGLDDRVAALVAGVPDADLTATPPRPLWVDRLRGAYGAWYELFPRSEGGFAGAAKRLAGHRRHGLRRRLPAARPSHRRHRPQGRRTTRCTRGRTIPAARGPSARPRAATRPSTTAWARWRTSSGSAPRPPTGAWRWRSTTRSSARPTIPGSTTTRSGSGAGPTAASASPRTRPRSTRTSTPSTSGPSGRPTARRCGRRAGTCCATGSTRASASSGSTTPTPSPWPSGPG